MHNKKTQKNILTILVVILLTVLAVALLKNYTLFLKTALPNQNPYFEFKLPTIDNQNTNTQVETPVGTKLRINLNYIGTEAIENVSGYSFTLNYNVGQLNFERYLQENTFSISALMAANPDQLGPVRLAGIFTNEADLTEGTTLLALEFTPLAAGSTTLSLNGFEISYEDETDTTQAQKITDTNTPVTLTFNITAGSLTQPIITSVSPSTITVGTSTTLLISGQNLTGSGITSVYLNQYSLDKTTVLDSSTKIERQVPSDLPVGTYNLIINYQNGARAERTDAVEIVTSLKNLAIEEAYFSPNQVKPNGVYKTTLWVLVNNTQGATALDYVNTDLSSIGGRPNSRLTSECAVNNNQCLVDNKQWFYLANITVPSTTVIKEVSYIIPVYATNKTGESANSSASLTITNQIAISERAPVVDSVRSYAMPREIVNNGQAKISFYAFVTDPDGAVDLKSVVIDLGSINQGVKAMTASEEEVTQGKWFYLKDLTVANTVAVGSKTAIITATDRSGASSEIELKFDVTGSTRAPRIVQGQGIKPYASPRMVPPDGKTPVSFYALVDDPDGQANLESVIIDLNTINLGIVSLEQSTSAGNGYWYVAKDLTVPTSAPKGSHRFYLRATDKDGNYATADLDLNVADISYAENGPMINSNKSYTTPNLAVNDNVTEVTLYTFVSDPDGTADIESVVVNLSLLNLAPTNQMLPVPSSTQGQGQSYALTIRVPQVVSPSTTPYELVVSATDKQGASAAGKILLRVASKLPEAIITPQMLFGLATNSTTVEVVFSKSLDQNNLEESGTNFRITDATTIDSPLLISRATISSYGTVVTLTTAPQEEGKTYTLLALDTLKDNQGIRLSSGMGDKLDFEGYQEIKGKPKARLATATSPTSVEVVFSQPLKPTSVNFSGNNFTIKELLNSSYALKVLQAEQIDTNLIRIKTAPQKAGVKYLLQIKKLLSAGDKELNSSTEFKGYVSALRGDLDYDGDVDFADFTIFASVYQKENNLLDENSNQNQNTGGGSNANANNNSNN